MTWQHGQERPCNRIPSSAAVNVFGAVPGTVLWNTASDDVPPGMRPATVHEEVVRLLRCHRADLPGYEHPEQVATAILHVLEPMGGSWRQ